MSCFEDLLKESDKLNHCVRGYGKHIESGRSMIVFIRLRLDEPLYTLELRKNQITQIRGSGNKDAPGEIYNIAKQYLHLLDKNLKKRQYDEKDGLTVFFVS